MCSGAGELCPCVCVCMLLHWPEGSETLGAELQVQPGQRAMLLSSSVLLGCASDLHKGSGCDLFSGCDLYSESSGTWDCTLLCSGKPESEVRHAAAPSSLGTY